MFLRHEGHEERITGKWLLFSRICPFFFVVFVLFVVSLAVRLRLRFDTTKDTKNTKNGVPANGFCSVVAVFPS